MKFNHYKIFIS